MGVGGQRHAPAALPLGKTRYPLYRRLGGPQGRSGRVRKISSPTGIRSPDRPTRSELLHRLSHSGPHFTYIYIYIYIYIGRFGWNSAPAVCTQCCWAFGCFVNIDAVKAVFCGRWWNYINTHSVKTCDILTVNIVLVRSVGYIGRGGVHHLHPVQSCTSAPPKQHFSYAVLNYAPGHLPVQV